MADCKEHSVIALIKNRWSPRAMAGETISMEELLSLFEAARWAPSSYNHQPWRFIYVKRNEPLWETYLNLMVPANREWAVNAGAFIVALSHKYFEYDNRYSRTHSLDVGAATQNLALQGYSMGLVVHAIEGFDYDQARIALGVPEDYDIEAMYIIGKPGPLAALSSKLQEREFPSDRMCVEEIIFHGRFGNKE